MSKRLQVILDDREYSNAMRLARRESKTLSQMVRELLREKSSRLAHSPERDPVSILAAMDLPAPGIKQMLADIERGRLS